MSKDHDQHHGRAAQLSEPGRIEAFLRKLIGTETAVPRDAAERLARRLAGRIKRVVVWEGDDVPPAQHAGVDAVSTTVNPPRDAATASPVRPQSAPAGPTSTSLPTISPPSTSRPSTSASPAFDPYAFSPVVVLTKAGKDGLMKRLATIEEPEQLRKLAQAQNLAVDPALTSLAELRAAIVKAAEQRIANRRAAAS